MTNKISGEMGTDIGLNGDKATTTIKTLRAALNEVTASWKAQEAALKSSGDMLGAASEKYKGLSSAVEKQQTVLNRLKSEQDKVDTSTNQGQQSFANYQKQIDNATTKLINLTNQQTKAKSSLDLQQSGILKLNDSIKQSESVTNSYVEKLKAEGNEAGATKAKINGLSDQSVKLNSLYNKQVEELNKLKSAEGDNSEAIAKQTVRVNETATKMAHATSEAKDLRDQLNKHSSDSFLSGITSKLDSVNEKTDKADHLFGKIVGAHLVAYGITNAFSSITSKIKEATDAGLEYDQEQQKMQAVWLTLTGTSGSASAMVKTINDLSVKTGQATDTVNELEQGFYHLHSSKTESDEMTKSMLNMADAVGLNSQQIQSVTQDMVNGLSRGKANAGMLNQISQYFPMFRENLAKYETQVHHGKEVTTADLTAMAKAGKISATDIETVFNQLGSGKYDKAASNMLATMVGMERTIKARVPALIGDIEQPIMNAQNPIYAAVSKWVSEKRVSDEFTKVGESAEAGFETITKAFSKAYDLKSIPDTLNGALTGLSKGITNVSNDIAKNAPEITNFFKMTKEMGGEGFRVVIASLEITNALLKPFLGLIADHPQAVARTAASLFLMSKAFTAVNVGIGFVNTTLKTFDRIGDGIKWAAKVLGIKSETAALKEQNQVLAENNDLSAAESSGSLGVSSASNKVSSGVSNVDATDAEASSAGLALQSSAKLSSSSALSSITSVGMKWAGRLTAGLGAGIALWDAGSSVAKAIHTGTASDKATAEAKTGGTVIGGAIGLAVGGPVGASIGASIGDAVGSTKTAQNIAKSLTSGINKEIGNYKINIPKISAAKAYKEVDSAREKELKTKYNAELAGLKVDKDNGLISEKQYQAQVTSINKSLKTINLDTTTNAQQRLAIGSKYAKDAQKIETSSAEKIRSIRKKYSQIIDVDRTNKAYGKMQQDQATESEKIAQVSANKKKAINKVLAKDTQTTAASMAKAYDQMTQKLQSSSSKQDSIMQNLTKNKGKLSNEQLSNAITESQKETNAMVKEATNRYNKTMKSAKKLEQDEIKAAKDTRTGAVAQANQKYTETVNAIYKEYTGTSKTAEKQRQTLIKKAQDTKTGAVKAADDQYKGVKDKADKQYASTMTDAANQENGVKNHANNQNKAVQKAATDQWQKVTSDALNQSTAAQAYAKAQSKGVVTHAVNQANGSMKASSKQGTGTSGIWNNIAKFFNGLTKPFGVKAIGTGKYDYGYSAMSMPAYAVGTGYNTARQALVGEAGIEARYQPYSGKVDFLGTHGAQVVGLNSGDKILNAKDTAKLFGGGLGKTLPGYASGTDSFSSFISSVGKGASSIWDNVSDAAETAISKLTDPIKTLEGIASKAFNVNSISEVGDSGHEISQGMVNTGTKAIGNFLSKLVSQAGSSNASNPVGSGVNRWKPVIEQAAKKLHVSLSAAGMKAVLHRINQESGGNPTITNNWDSNAKAGTPSKGLLQYIQPTLAHWVPKGVAANLSSGYSQLAAMFNDSNWLKDISVKGGWGPTGLKKYKNGGWANTTSIFGDDGLEVAIPMEQSKHSRAVELLNEANQKVNGASTSATTNTSKLESLMTTLVQLASGQISELQNINQNSVSISTVSKSVENSMVRRLS
ncbi:tape measure protein [Oenococcus sicerae]|uniref:tape measure protein n=1 Tax=Oenococcus sicerae TaxID=2203724 RepID=UPI0039ED107C